MNYLLDTNILIWCLENNKSRLRKEVIDVVNTASNLIYVSAVNTWEIAIKAKIGKLRLEKDLLPLLRKKDFEFISIDLDDTLKTLDLPDIHQDPFDRLLIAQAEIRKLKIITADKTIGKYTKCLIN